MKTITISGCKRPWALRQTLESLRKCEGFKEYHALVVLDDHPKGDRSITQECMEVAEGFPIVVNHKNEGCNATILKCLHSGFQLLQSSHKGDPKDFHIHLEDDTVPAKAFLRFMEYASERFYDQEGVLSVSGFSKSTEGPPNACKHHPHFICWGWGTWRNRYETLLHPYWNRHDKETSWDTHIQKCIKTWRGTIKPCVSLIQNIGNREGTYLPNPEEHALYHHSEEVLDSVPTEWVTLPKT